jgi:hypothetical protein
VTPEDWRREPRAIRVRTEEEAVSRAAAEHWAYAGQLLRVQEVMAYFTDCCDYTESGADAVVRVRPAVSQNMHWNDEYLDPYWDVDIVKHPQRDQIEHAWIYGRSYEVVELSPLEELSQAAWAPDYRGAP